MCCGCGIKKNNLLKERQKFLCRSFLCSFKYTNVFLVNNRPYKESRIYAVPCAIFVKSDMLPPETYDGNCHLPKVRIKNK